MDLVAVGAVLEDLVLAGRVPARLVAGAPTGPRRACPPCRWRILRRILPVSILRLSLLRLSVWVRLVWLSVFLRRVGMALRSLPVLLRLRRRLRPECVSSAGRDAEGGRGVHRRLPGGNRRRFRRHVTAAPRRAGCPRVDALSRRVQDGSSIAAAVVRIHVQGLVQDGAVGAGRSRRGPSHATTAPSVRRERGSSRRAA